MKKISIVFLIFSLCFIFSAVGYAQKYSINLKPALKKSVEAQLEKEEKNGYEQFKLLYIKDANGKVRLIYSAINTELSSSYTGTDRWLLGFTFSDSYGKWFYSGGKSKAYLSEEDYDDMKVWAKKIENW